MTPLLRSLGALLILAGIGAAVYFLSLQESALDRITRDYACRTDRLSPKCVSGSSLSGDLLTILAVSSFVSGVYFGLLALGLGGVIERLSRLEAVHSTGSSEAKSTTATNAPPA